MRRFFDFFSKGRLGESSLPSGDLKVLSFFPPDQLSPQGLPGIAIQGTFTDSQCTVEGFRVNSAFVDFMHEVIRTIGPTHPSMQEAAARQKDGCVYVIDLRTPEGPLGRVPPEDIIGAFQVKEGKLIADSYWRNEKHRVLTENGPVQLPPYLEQALVSACGVGTRSANALNSIQSDIRESSIRPLPEPGTLILVGSGLRGLADFQNQNSEQSHMLCRC